MKYWVFDLDGTLVDSLTPHFEVVGKVHKHFQKEFNETHHLELLKQTAKNFHNYLAQKLGEENKDEAFEMFRELSIQNLTRIQAFDGIEDILKTLQARNLPLAIWTARDKSAAEKIVEHTGLTKYFPIRISGDCTAQAKPHPEGLERIAKHFNCKPEDMVMVGDFDSDMLGARAFGTTAVRVNWHNSVPQKNCELAHYKFDTTAEFNNWIKTEIK